MFTSLNINDKGTGDESTLVKERPVCLEGDDSNAKTEKSGFGEVKTLTSDVPTILDYKDFNYDNLSLVECISLFQSIISSPKSYEQNKAFTEHIVEAMIKAYDEKLELEVSIPRKLHDEWEPTMKITIGLPPNKRYCFMPLARHNA